MNAGKTAVTITERGQQRAEALLKELYDYSNGKPSGWGISKVGPDGQWKHLYPPRDQSK